MSLHISLNTIEELKELPKVERSEDRGGFFYPEEFIGNVYKYNNKIVYFNERTMEEISVGMLDILIQLINSGTFDNSEIKERQDNIESAFEQFETDVLQTLDHMKNSVNSVSKQENIHKDFENKLLEEINELSKKNTESNTQTREYCSLIEKKLEDQIESISLDLMQEIEKSKEREDLNDLISSKIDLKLTDVHKAFKSVVESLVKEEVSKIESEIRAKSNKLTVSQIAMFKEIGLSVDNIIEMKKNNML